MFANLWGFTSTVEATQYGSLSPSPFYLAKESCRNIKLSKLLVSRVIPQFGLLFPLLML